MSDVAKELEKIILKAGIDGALTEDAVAQFHALVTERNALRSELDDVKKQNARLDQRIVEVNEKYSEAVQSNDAWATRDKELKDREDKVTRLEVEKECAEQRVADHKHMFETVFKGVHMRRQVVTPGSSTVDQYGTKTSDYPDTTDVVDQE